VYLAGFIPDAANLLCAFDIFALTSTKEGLPYVLLEAGEAKCAVVATRIPGTTDIIDKNTGLLVSPRSVRETTDALDALITDEEKRHMLGDALHLQVREKFSKSKMLEEIGMVYR
jgi:glycosyltransferase involved in cell wall biosynthesis